MANTANMTNATCTVSITILSCGHNLIAHSHTCPASSLPFCEPLKQRRYLNDICAQCDPEMQRNLVRREYERRHAELMREHIRAKGRGDTKLMARIEEMDMQNLRASHLSNFRISLLRRDPDVLLPGQEFGT